MKHPLQLKGIALTVAATLTSCLPAFALPTDFFSSTSPFANGKWVKISVNETGLYEISYDRLRQLGFSDPSKVGVFGNGGTSLEENFTDRDNNIIFHQRPQGVPVFHSGERLIFFANGVDNIKCSKVSNISGFDYWYNTSGSNIYSSKGWYFLSDTGKVEMQTSQALTPIGNTSIATTGISFAADIAHTGFNPSKTGRYFTTKLIDQGYTSIQTPLPGAVFNEKGALYVEFMAEPDSEPYTIKFYNRSQKFQVSNSENLSKVSVSASFTLNSTKGVFSVTKPNPEQRTFSALGTTVFNYTRYLPARNSTFDQLRFLLNTAPAGNSVKITLPSENALVIDITDTSNPLVRTPDVSDNNSVIFNNNGKQPDIIIYDSRRPLKKITDFRTVRDTGLRDKLLSPADMLIVTVPALKEKAERLAQIHASTDGVRCVVATLPELYNEFTSGTPDPMAIRAAVKMMEMSGNNSLRNILLFGPFSSDVRNMDKKDNNETLNPLSPDPVDSENEYNAIIAYQNNGDFNYTNGCGIFPEFYALTNDHNYDTSPERWMPGYGVGVLPVHSLQEADLIIAKTSDYLNDNTVPYRMNRSLSIGCHSNQQSHTRGALSAAEELKVSSDDRFINSIFLLEAYPKNQWVDHFYNEISKAPVFASYFGHGSYLQMSEHFITRSTLSRFSNSQFPFMCFMGCELSGPDRGSRGIGEETILGTRRGFVGGLVSVRTTLESNNRYLFSAFVNNLMKDSKGNFLQKPLSLGEALSKAKSSLIFHEKSCYILLCDPSLTLPLPTLGISADIGQSSTPGYISLSGQIIDTDGSGFNDFNGEAVIRVMADPKILTSANYVSPNEQKYQYTVEDITEGIFAASVKDGRFDLNIPAISGSENLNLVISAYDPAGRLGAGMKLSKKNTFSSETSPLDDDIPPVIDELYYDDSRREAVMTVSDNICIFPPLSPLDNNHVLSLDGKSISNIHLANPVIDTENHGFSLRVALPQLSDGQHSLILSSTDKAGNVTEAEHIFYVGGSDQSLTLSFDAKALYDEIGLSVQGDESAGDLTLYVEDAKGEFLGTLDVYDGFIWDGTVNGSRLPTGVYRLHLKGSEGVHSAPVDLPVLR